MRGQECGLGFDSSIVHIEVNKDAGLEAMWTMWIIFLGTSIKEYIYRCLINRQYGVARFQIDGPHVHIVHKSTRREFPRKKKKTGAKEKWTMWTIAK